MRFVIQFHGVDQGARKISLKILNLIVEEARFFKKIKKLLAQGDREGSEKYKQRCQVLRQQKENMEIGKVIHTSEGFRIFLSLS